MDPPDTDRACVERHDIAFIFIHALVIIFEELELCHQQTPATVLVVDAIDECEHDQDMRATLQSLPRLQKAKPIGLRITSTSRPKLPIRLGFLEMTNHNYQDLALHEISEKVTKHDISLFLKDLFAAIRRNEACLRTGFISDPMFIESCSAFQSNRTRHSSPGSCDIKTQYVFICCISKQPDLSRNFLKQI
jgi:hypothetical protein